MLLNLYEIDEAMNTRPCLEVYKAMLRKRNQDQCDCLCKILQELDLLGSLIVLLPER